MHELGQARSGNGEVVRTLVQVQFMDLLSHLG